MIIIITSFQFYLLYHLGLNAGATPPCAALSTGISSSLLFDGY